MELARHYGLPENGKQNKWFIDLLHEVGLSEELFKHNLSENRRKHPIITKQCLQCNKDFQVSEGSSKEERYCSHLCANRAPRKPRSPESKERVRQKLMARALTKNGKPGPNSRARKERPCQYCGTSFLPKLEKTRYCSPSCRSSAVGQRPEYRRKLRDVQLRHIANGTHQGWKSRAKMNISYAERFFMKVLNLNHIPYEREVSQSSYFIDFAITLDSGHKIALEIDGKQHKLPERAASDARKDEALRKADWHVHRIPWCSINSETGKQKMKAQIDGFLTVYRSLLNATIL